MPKMIIVQKKLSKMLREFTGMIHSVGFYQKMAIDESILRFVIPTWILLNFYSTVSSLVWENELKNWEMFTILKLAIFLVKSDTV